MNNGGCLLCCCYHLLIGSCIWMSFENHCNTLSTGCTRCNQTQLAIFTHKPICLQNKTIKSLNLFILFAYATVNSPYAWPNEHRWQQMDVQSTVIHPNCSIYSYRANRLYHPNRCSSCRTNPNRVLSNWHKFVPKRRFCEFELRKWSNKWITSELTANASCTSHVSMSVCLRPAFCKILGMPYAGPSNSSLIGSCETYVKSRTYAFGLRPSSLALASDMIKQADAPSVYEQTMRIFIAKYFESNEINDSV